MYLVGPERYTGAHVYIPVHMCIVIHIAHHQYYDTPRYTIVIDKTVFTPSLWSNKRPAQTTTIYVSITCRVITCGS